MTRSHPPRSIAAIIPAGITFLAVVVLLVVARVYDNLPVHAPECGFRTALGIPCLSCGGTRSMQALANGNVADALKLNPAVVIGILATVVWLGIGIRRFRRGFTEPAPAAMSRRIKLVSLSIAAVLFLNWIYLILTLE